MSTLSLIIHYFLVVYEGGCSDEPNAKGQIHDSSFAISIHSLMSQVICGHSYSNFWENCPFSYLKIKLFNEKNFGSPEMLYFWVFPRGASKFLIFFAAFSFMVGGDEHSSAPQPTAMNAANTWNSIISRRENVVS